MEPDLGRLLALYDAGRFLDIYEETKKRRTPPDIVPELSPEVWIYGGRFRS